MEGAGMEKSISRLPEDCRHLVVVVGHQLWFGGLLGKREEAMDILHSLKSFLKEKSCWKCKFHPEHAMDYTQ